MGSEDTLRPLGAGRWRDGDHLLVEIPAGVWASHLANLDGDLHADPPFPHGRLSPTIAKARQWVVRDERRIDREM